MDDDERLNKELELVFAKPEVGREIREAYAAVTEFESLHRRYRWIRLVRGISIAVGILTVLSFASHLTITLVDDTTRLSAISWLMLCFAVEAGVMIAILSVWGSKLGQRIQAIHQYRLEKL